MRDPFALYELRRTPSGEERAAHAPLLVSLQGFGDAGSLTETVSQHLLDHLDHEVVAELDADELTDYRSRRPRVTFVRDHVQDYQSPKLLVHLLHDEMGAPFYLLSGPEPDYQWDRAAQAVRLLADELGVGLTVWSYGVPVPVPHTRPMAVTVHTNRPELRVDSTELAPTVELFAGFGHRLELTLDAAGRDVAGYAVLVPHYLRETEFPDAAVAALDRMAKATGLMIPLGDLRQRGQEITAKIDAEVKGNPGLNQMVMALEGQYDKFAEGSGQPSLLASPAPDLPDADELGAEVERFLAHHDEQGGDDHGSDDGGKGDDARPDGSGTQG